MPLLEMKPLGFSLGNVLFNGTFIPLCILVGYKLRNDSKKPLDPKNVNTAITVLFILAILVWLASVFPMEK